jgi:hypothetical protein
LGFCCLVRQEGRQGTLFQQHLGKTNTAARGNATRHFVLGKSPRPPTKTSAFHAERKEDASLAVRNQHDTQVGFSFYRRIWRLMEDRGREVSNIMLSKLGFTHIDNTYFVVRIQTNGHELATNQDAPRGSGRWFGLRGVSNLPVLRCLAVSRDSANNPNHRFNTFRWVCFRWPPPEGLPVPFGSRVVPCSARSSAASVVLPAWPQDHSVEARGESGTSNPWVRSSSVRKEKHEC